MMHTLTLAVAVALGSQLLLAGVGVAEEDHLEGYKIKDLNQVAPPASPYTITNQFGSETCELKKPQFFLTQSEKNGGDDARGGEPGNFVCYKAKCTGTVPGLTEEDSQFGLHNLEFKKAKLVCLPVDPPCAGVLVGGFCWYLGASFQSCDDTCSAMGQTCDAAGTVNYAGTGGTLAQCDAVLDALAGPGLAADSPTPVGIGCAIIPLRVRFTGAPTDCSIAAPGAQRACACAP